MAFFALVVFCTCALLFGGAAYWAITKKVWWDRRAMRWVASGQSREHIEFAIFVAALALVCAAGVSTVIVKAWG